MLWPLPPLRWFLHPTTSYSALAEGSGVMTDVWCKGARLLTPIENTLCSEQSRLSPPWDYPRWSVFDILMDKPGEIDEWFLRKKWRPDPLVLPKKCQLLLHMDHNPFALPLAILHFPSFNRFTAMSSTLAVQKVWKLVRFWSCEVRFILMEPFVTSL